MIYLDNAATTNMFEGCVEVIKEYSCYDFYNPSAIYFSGAEKLSLLNEQRQYIKKMINALSGDVVFTSGATESNNLAIFGSLRSGNCEYVFSNGEHPSVYNVAKSLEEKGSCVKFVNLQSNGQIDYEDLKNKLSNNTRLISVMLVSNETGAINDISKINEIRKQICPRALLHVDGVQAFCKINVDVTKWNVDLFTISAHKFHGPKGVGALYVKNKESLKNIIFGGGQEFGVRSGTENLPNIMAMIHAIKNIDIQKNYDLVKNNRQALIDILKQDEGVKIREINGSPYILSIEFSGINGETLIHYLENEVIIGIGSACSSKKAGNRILQNMGESLGKIKSSVRISFNAYQSIDEIKKAGEIILKAYQDIKRRVG